MATNVCFILGTQYLLSEKNVNVRCPVLTTIENGAKSFFFSIIWNGWNKSRRKNVVLRELIFLAKRPRKNAIFVWDLVGHIYLTLYSKIANEIVHNSNIWDEGKPICCPTTEVAKVHAANVRYYSWIWSVELVPTTNHTIIASNFPLPKAPRRCKLNLSILCFSARIHLFHFTLLP